MHNIWNKAEQSSYGRVKEGHRALPPSSAEPQSALSSVLKTKGISIPPFSSCDLHQPSCGLNKLRSYKNSGYSCLFLYLGISL